MTGGTMSRVVQQLRRAVLLPDGAGLTDGQLLTRFIELRDEAAFTALVRRHGSMVLGVCRRILRNHHDAEDAFQATFLVLARKAAAVQPPELLPNWLFGVAHTTAVRARGTTARRRARETLVTQLPDPAGPGQPPGDDLRPLLDRELSHLPAKYRTPILLCDLEGKSHKEAARQLGWPVGTVSGRLARARTMLGKRLARHGLGVSGGLLAAVLSERASAAVPAPLVAATVRAARLFAAGQAAAPGLIPAGVVALTQGVLSSMKPSKFKVVASVVLGAGLLAFAVASSLSAAGKERIAPPATAPRQTREPRELVLEWKILGFTPEGREEIVPLPKVTFEEGQAFQVHCLDGFSTFRRIKWPKKAQQLADDLTRPGIYTQVRTTGLKAGKVRLELALFENWAEEADEGDTQVIGNSVRVSRQVRLGKTQRIVFIRGKSGAARRRLEFVIQNGPVSETGGAGSPVPFTAQRTVPQAEKGGTGRGKQKELTGVRMNADAGLTGSIILNERNFDARMDPAATGLGQHRQTILTERDLEKQKDRQLFSFWIGLFK